MDSVFNRPIETNSVSKKVIETIKEAIVRGELRPGDAFPSESELVKNLGVSKTSVREAIKMLEAIGVAEIRRGTGTVLSDNPNAGYMNVLVFQLMLQQGNHDEFIEFRRVFEVAYTHMAIEKATPEDLEHLTQSVVQFESRIRGNMVRVEDDLDFHSCVLMATHNDFIISLGKAINTLFAASIEQSIRETPQKALETHQNICRAICEKNKEEAERYVTQSIEMWRNNLG